MNWRGLSWCLYKWGNRPSENKGEGMGYGGGLTGKEERKDMHGAV